MTAGFYADAFRSAIPETILVTGALAVLVADATMRRLESQTRFMVGALLSGVACAAAIAWMLIAPGEMMSANGLETVTRLGTMVKLGVAALTLFTALISAESDFTAHVGEFFALVLMSAVGMMLLAGAEDILMIFISLELISLPLYVLTAFSKTSVRSAEAGLKYFLFGSMSAAFMLFGLSLVYGIAGTTNLNAIATAMAGRNIDPLLAVAIVMVVAGFGFKVAAVPFHLWAPDAYEGAPAPAAGFIASGSKLASFFVFAKVMAVAFAGLEGGVAWSHFAAGWVPVIGFIAAVSMVLGNLAAIVQSSVRRLIAYSAIAHGGYMLLAVLSRGEQSMASLIYYAFTYGLTVIGAFGVIAVVQNGNGGEQLKDFAGLSRRAPVVSFCMLIFMLSLAGIPPLAGFFGKFYVFTAALGSDSGLGALWLVILAVAMSAVSLYYYLQVLKQIYAGEPLSAAESSKVPVFTQVVLALLAACVVIFGSAPSLILDQLHRAMQ